MSMSYFSIKIYISVVEQNFAANVSAKVFVTVGTIYFHLSTHSTLPKKEKLFITAYTAPQKHATYNVQPTAKHNTMKYYCILVVFGCAILGSHAQTCAADNSDIAAWKRAGVTYFEIDTTTSTATFNTKLVSALDPGMW